MYIDRLGNPPWTTACLLMSCAIPPQNTISKAPSVYCSDDANSSNSPIFCQHKSQANLHKGDIIIEKNAETGGISYSRKFPTRSMKTHTLLIFAVSNGSHCRSTPSPFVRRISFPEMLPTYQLLALSFEKRAKKCEESAVRKFRPRGQD